MPWAPLALPCGVLQRILALFALSAEANINLRRVALTTPVPG